MMRRLQRLRNMLGVSMAVVALCAALAGCAGWKSFEPPVADEIPDGPGSFSGEEGELVIFRR